MKKRFTILIAAIAAILLFTQPTKVMGQERGNTAYYTLTCTNQSGNSAYASNYDVNITDGLITMTWNAPGNQTITGNFWRIGGAKGTNVSRTITGKTAMGHSISQIVINHNGRSNSNLIINSVSVTISYNSGFTNLVETITKNSPSVSSSGSLVFEPDDVEIWPKDCYYKITVVYTHNKSNNYGLDITSIDFKMPTYTVTYDPGEGSGEMTDEDSPYEPGQTVTLLSNTFDAPGGKEFNGWIVTDEDDAPVSVSNNQFTMPSKDVTVTAQWRSSGDPNIVINGGNNITIASPAATGAQTTSIAYNNMTVHENEEIALYYDSECTSSFPNNGWFTASLSGTNNTTLNYSAALNEVGERTVYIKVTSHIGETTYYSVISATQATSTRTITYQANGGTGSNVVKTYGYGTNVTILAYNDDAIDFTAPEGSYFKNWEDDSSIPYNAGATITSIADNYTLSAQWEAFPIYYLVTSSNQIVAGKHYVIASSAEEGDAYGIGAPNGTYRDRTSVTISTDTDDNLYITKTAYLCDFVLSGKDSYDKWTLYDKTNGVYLYGGSKGTLGGNDGSTGIPPTAKFSLTLTDDGDIEFNNNGFIIEYNGSNPRFASYARTMGKVYLYVKEDDEDLETYSDIMLNDNWTVTGNLTIHSGIVTVPNTKTLTVTGTLTNTTAANFVIADGGQLITSSTGVQATVKKTINNWNTNSWYFVSSPLTGTTAYSGDGNKVTGMITDTYTGEDNSERTYDLYLLDQTKPSGSQWQNYRQHGFTLNNGMGYLYASKEGTTLEFSGTVQPSNESKTVSDLVANDFNLVGNPFTCEAYVNMDCYTISDASTGITGSTTATLASVAIPTCTGVVVKPEGTSVKFGKEYPVTSANNGNLQMVLSQTVTNRGGKSVETLDNAIISFNEGSQLEKFYFGNQNANIYIPQNKEEYAIVSASAFGELPVNFTANQSGEYTLTFNAEDVEMGYLHLIDNMTGANVDLLANPSYTFNANVDDYESRFRLVFSAKDVETTDGNADFAFINDGNLIVAGTGTVRVYDITGRMVASSDNANSVSTVGMTPGVYVLQLVNGTETKTQKIIVK